jgi:NAD(P)-dependent dehydrogenase (short-subunit alcohol dehydrogenase family)
MQGKHVLITGGTAGIGRETALGLARLGADVTLLGRDRAKAERAAAAIRTASGNDAVSALAADLADRDAVHQAAEEYRLRHKRLDVLLNNAGLFLPRREVTRDGQEWTFATVYLGHYLLTQLLLERLKAAEQGRILFVTCPPAQARVRFEDLTLERGYSTLKAQFQAKGALFMLMHELCYRVSGTPVTVNCMLPGLMIRTDLLANMPFYMRWAVRLFGMSPAKAAEAQIWLASAPELAGVTNRYFLGRVEKPLSGQIVDDQATRKLWQLSQALMGI